MQMSVVEALRRAQREGYAIGQFNAASLEVLHAITAVARELGAPVIIGTSEGERAFAGVREMAAFVRIARETLDVPVFLNADHTRSLKRVQEALDAGYDAVHFDGSELPLTENLSQTRQAVQMTKRKSRHIFAEGELGYLRGTSELHSKPLAVRPEDLTDPTLARRFVDETGVDGLAIAIGSFHGMVAPGAGGAAERLDLERLSQIREATGAFLVLHGASGLEADDLREAVRRGIVKVNVNTELRVAFAEALHAELHEHPEITTPYKMYEPAIEAIKKVVGEKIRLLGSAGKSS